jgi:hypothetical protein
MYVCMYVYAYVCMYVCMDVYMYVDMDLCMYAFDIHVMHNSNFAW